MTEHIGIVACTAEGAALCYRTICSEGEALLGRHAHPEVSLHTYSLHEYIRLIQKGDWDGVAELMALSAEKVARAGADFIICPDNTIHQAFDRAVQISSLPWLHIAEEVAVEAARRPFHRLGILGTRYLMEGPVYPGRLSSKYLDCRIPEPDDRRRIHEIIIDEVIHGRISSASRCYLMEIIGRFKEQGCDAVVLGCTELPLLITSKYSPLPLLDSTRILARAALRRTVLSGAAELEKEGTRLYR
jgi:aspartate racemase